MVTDFIDGLHGKKEVVYMHPLLESILKETFGVVLYQEQVMQIVQVLAGFSLGQADLLRRAMGKKKHELLMAQKEIFLQGCAKNGLETSLANHIFDLLTHFADYGFNKSHSAAYGLLAWQTAYLKAHYPVEFMAGVLTSIMDKTDKIPVYIQLCRQMGIKILPPDINSSAATFGIEDGAIRFGLAAVRNVGENAIVSMERVRAEGGKFRSLVDFCARVDMRAVNKRALESLITPKTKVITAVDFGGNPVNLDAILKLAKQRGIKVLDDASHALGSSQSGVKVGAKADVSIFSFHPVKPLTTFEGGALATNDDEIARLARLYRSHGIAKKRLWDSDMSLLGYNYRLPDVACALGLNQLKRLDETIAAREKIAKFYDEKFDKNPYFSTVKLPGDVVSSRHLYPILLFRQFWCAKEDIFAALHARGIGVQVHYKPTYKFSFYRERYGDISVPSAEDFYAAELSIPCHQCMSLEDANFVADALFEVLKSFDTPQGCRV